MTALNHERMTVRGDENVVVFLIGARINKWWRIDKWFPVARAFTRMMKELSDKPETGFLGYESWGGNPSIAVQYWRSIGDLMAYAKDKNGEHFPAWLEFRKKIAKSNVVGIWHETYFVPTGNYECIYESMPRFGLGKVFEPVPATGHLHDAKKRLAANAASVAEAG